MSPSAPPPVPRPGLPATPPSPPHLLLPFAACLSEGWRPAVQAVASLRQLQTLLQGMAVLRTDAGPDRSLSPPHERALAHELGWSGLADGLLPWAAWQRAASPGTPDAALAWAVVTPCHWAMGREHATLSDPQALRLTEAESRALLAAMQPYFEEDGMTLHYAEPQRWLAAGELFRGQATASLDRVLGRDVDRWLPSGASARTLHRLQNEMQMLMYTHPVNELRTAQRQMPVNSIWFSGTGDLPAACPPWPIDLQAPRTLADAALAEDWSAYTQAWQALDADALAQLLARQEAGETVRLTLCGERQAVTLQTAPRSWLARLAASFKRPDCLSLLDTL